MTLCSYLQALLLGVVEGLTEFIPVSSTGHLILVGDMLEFKSAGNVFEIVIQLGAILAICWIYRTRLIETAKGIFTDKKAKHFAWMILLAFLPSVVVGAFAYSFIKQVLFSPWVVSSMLVIGGFIILLIERLPITPQYTEIDTLSYRRAFYIGCCQIISMIPGTSRSGATIMGALLLKVDRKTAAEFSFFLAIPTMFAATTYDIYQNYHMLNEGNISLIIIGLISAFFSALIVVKWFIRFISTHNFVIFAWYRITIGLFMLGWLFSRPI